MRTSNTHRKLHVKYSYKVFRNMAGSELIQWSVTIGWGDYYEAPIGQRIKYHVSQIYIGVLHVAVLLGEYAR